MALRQSSPKHVETIAAAAATVLLATSMVSTVKAAPNVETRCDDVADATFLAPLREFKAEVVSHDTDDAAEGSDASESDTLSPVQFLAPRAADAIREAFTETVTPAEETASTSDDPSAAETSEDPELRRINARIPGVTDSELARYRRQMYRSDI